ncbi:hypothetical protein K1T71_010527 [Dendrolimus kikuchii]|uniref:Uncharacterized protein n=1 Tax=Dendrolimus kikuchii TaxID=765133 RepID=A0ACC1CS76_9NEOP|nr:hypothetical protein K1T71_010527 [Dendrolimus kikuchii]
MFWRKLTKIHKTVYIVITYLSTYLLISYVLTPEATVTFVSDDIRVGDKYVLLFLVAPKAPVFTDVEGAEVFQSRKCGQCFLTNNRGFLPMSEYDGVLVYGDKYLLTKTGTVSNKYVIETNNKCIHRKLKCLREPKITSFSTNQSYTLCSLCDEMLQKRKV